VAEEDPRWVEQEVLKAFEPLAPASDSALRRVLVSAFDYAIVHQAPGATPETLGPSPGLEFVIDKRAVFNALVGDGISNRQMGTSTLWLVDWLDARGINTRALLASGGRERHRDSLSSSAQIVVSRSLLRNVIPAARRLALETTGQDQPKLRHLALAMLDDCPPDWFGLEPDGELWSRLRYEFLGRNAEFYPREAEGWLQARASANEGSPSATEELDETPTSAATSAEAVATHADAPALEDRLGRQAFAEVLGARIRQVGAGLSRADPHTDSTFILHMDGPWGSGKSSILNFLKADLEGSDPSWLVVEFNAWRNQSRKPPWWPLISEVGQAIRALKWYQAPKARLVWAWWKIKSRWVPLLLTALLIGAFLYFAWTAVVGTGAGSSGLPKAFQEAVSALLALVALGGLSWTTSRKLSFGSSNAAEEYIKSSAEPFRRVVTLFERLVRAVGRPVAVFIDDLDRCDCAYVIDLIEGVQTLLRSAPVVYVVAGDRKWICSSFEKRYADFSDEIGTPARPLGYLFLDKVFQLSTSVPRLSLRYQAEYWRHLLDRTDGHQLDDDRRDATKMQAESAEALRGKTSHEDIQSEIEKAPEGSLQRDVLRAAAAKQITSAEAIRASEHRLQPFAGLLEANPRSMKRLVNAYGLNHARAYLEGRNVSVEALARWTIIELRWPLLAEYVSQNWPEIVEESLVASAFPIHFRDLLADGEVRAVIGAEGEAGRLTLQALRPILD